jgi:hypothetical protein
MRSITQHFNWNYNGIDTLIRIDGYYYGLCGENSNCVLGDENFCLPFIVTEKGEYKGQPGMCYTHDAIIASFYEFYPKIKKGNYQVKDDTITINTVGKFGPWSYDIIKYIFVILNDTTLEQIYYSNVRVNDTIVNRDRLKFRFYQYDIEKFK